MLTKVLTEAKVDASMMVTDETRVTTTKTRISGSSAQSVTQQIIRIDRETSEPVSKQTEAKKS